MNDIHIGLIIQRVSHRLQCLRDDRGGQEEHSLRGKIILATRVFDKTDCTERDGSVATHETRIREGWVQISVYTNLTGFFRGFPQSSRQMLRWIFITAIYLTIKFIYHKIKISELNK